MATCGLGEKHPQHPKQTHGIRGLPALLSAPKWKFVLLDAMHMLLNQCMPKIPADNDYIASQLSVCNAQVVTAIEAGRTVEDLFCSSTSFAVTSIHCLPTRMHPFMSTLTDAFTARGMQSKQQQSYNACLVYSCSVGGIDLGVQDYTCNAG